MKMNLKLYHGYKLRIVGDFEDQNFIDIEGVGYESLAIGLFKSFHYIEIREKESMIRVFTFPKKSLKKECDFGWWADAEVVFSRNEIV